jgi:error-prone DNA polymerase
MAALGTTYVELQVTSHFSFLRGSSSPEELFAAAALLRHRALGLADWGSVAGVVRGWDGQTATGVRMIPGARVDLTDGRALLLYPIDRRAWSRLTRLLSAGKARGGKGCCILDWCDVAAHAEGLIAILVPDLADDTTAAHLAELREVFGARGYLALSLRRRPDDAERLHQLDGLARAAGMRSVATGDVLYHAPEARPLQDVMTAIREKTTIDALGFRRERFMDRNLKSPAEMERRFPMRSRPAPISPRNAGSIWARSNINIPMSRSWRAGPRRKRLPA